MASGAMGIMTAPLGRGLGVTTGQSAPVDALQRLRMMGRGPAHTGIAKPEGGYYTPQEAFKMTNGQGFTMGGWNTSGVGPGTAGYHGSGRIGSAAGALYSGGIPTSQRGRFEKFGDAAAQLPTWMVGQGLMASQGLSQSGRFGNMGRLPYSPAQLPMPAPQQQTAIPPLIRKPDAGNAPAPAPAQPWQVPLPSNILKPFSFQAQDPLRKPEEGQLPTLGASLNWLQNPFSLY